MTVPATAQQARRQLSVVRAEWRADNVTCHFCGGPSFAWLTDDETWAQVEPLLGQQQACFECFAAARVALGLDDGEPLRVSLAALASRLEQAEQALRFYADGEHYGWREYAGRVYGRVWLRDDGQVARGALASLAGDDE